MSRPYEEILNSATLPRSAPGDRHEQICARLHREMAAGIAGLSSTQLLAPRTRVQLSRTTAFCPDLALVAGGFGKIISRRRNHQPRRPPRRHIHQERDL